MGKIEDGVQTNYLIDPNGILPQVLAEMDASNNLIAFYVYDGAGLVAKITSSNDYYYYHYDGLGSTVAITDENAQIVNAYAYSPYGLLGAQETITNPFTYVGRFGVMAEGNGLYYMRARYYDPEAGRFINKDPIGYVGGMNLYGYVGGNPVNFIDPLGFKKGDWWDPRTYVSLTISRTLLVKGVTQTFKESMKIYGGKEQETYSPTTLYGISFDLYIGIQPSPCDEVTEFGLGIGKHLGIGHFYGRPDELGDYQVAGLALHLGIGLGLPFYVSQIAPDPYPDRPFSDLSDLELYYTAPKERK